MADDVEDKLYLEEDDDLLKELDSVGPMSTGMALSEQERKISAIQIRSILRNRKTASELDKSTSRYSRAVIALTFVLLVVALMQLAVTVFAPFPPGLVQVFVFVSAAGVIAWTFRKTVRDFLE